MDIMVQTTPADARTAIAEVSADLNVASVAVQSADDPRVAAARAAASALIEAAGLGQDDPVEVSLAFSDEPGWAVVRVAKVIPASG